MAKAKPSTLASVKLVCPCCGKERAVIDGTPLLTIEQTLRDRNADPWQRSTGWSVDAARQGRLQWACSLCIKQSKGILAQPWNEKFCDYEPYFAYFDRIMNCEGCGKQFTFTAKEQQYWYEKLKFWVQSHPKHCVECRRKRRNYKQAQRELKLAMRELDERNPSQMLRIAQLHILLGNKDSARIFLNKAKKYLKTSEQLEEIQKQLSGLDAV